MSRIISTTTLLAFTAFAAHPSELPDSREICELALEVAEGVFNSESEQLAKLTQVFLQVEMLNENLRSMAEFALRRYENGYFSQIDELIIALEQNSEVANSLGTMLDEKLTYLESNNALVAACSNLGERDEK